MKSVLKKIVFFLTVIILSVLYGIAIVKMKLPPYHLAAESLNKLRKKPDSVEKIPEAYFHTPEEYFATNPIEIISIHQAEDISILRDSLITLLWGRFGLPSTIPDSTNPGFKDDRYGDIAHLTRIDRYRIEMEFGLESIVYHFIPDKPTDKLMLYHEGHTGDFVNSKKQIATLLQNGFSVAAFSMPLHGMNSKPTVYLPGFGYLKITNHNQIKFLQPNSGHPLKFFIEPVIITINHLENRYSEISMMGLSGGGLTTVFAAAIDPRIKRSYHISGSLPLFLRSNVDSDWGDYEQSIPEVLRIANYLEIYIMGSCGPGRKQFQIINQFDACCFAGTRYEVYSNKLQSFVKSLGAGEFTVFVDSTHRDHIISEYTMDRILKESNRM